MTLVAAGIVAWAWALGRSEVRSFELDAAREIGALLQGEHKRVSVRTRPAGLTGAFAAAEIRASSFSADALPLFTEPERSTRGVLHELRLDLRDFRLRDLRVERLTAKIPDCRFDYSLAVRSRKIRLSRAGVGSGTVELRDSDLESFVLRKFPEIKRIRIRAEQGTVRVEGYGEFLVVATEFVVIAKLVPKNETQLELSSAEITMDGRPATEPAQKALLRALNPVVDLRADLGLYNAVLLDSVEVVPGRIVAKGRTTIPTRPKGGTP